MSVPAKRWFGSNGHGSMTNPFTGMFGIPVAELPTEVQVGVAELRFVVFQICPAVAGFV